MDPDIERTQLQAALQRKLAAARARDTLSGATDDDGARRST
jgi:hypothetical protein